ncbi:hypothetical protein HYW58_00565 [Candidatus Kaiserbacteria bacterium]|nr:hypothetical protein [Candidatus Kaiserbacteria bacterium]
MPLNELMYRIETFIINPLLLLFFAFGLLFFLWGMVQFIWKADSEDGRKTGVQHMLWGIIGMFIMVAAYGIINLIVNTFGL